jgi:hypothetical protein
MNSIPSSEAGIFGGLGAGGTAYPNLQDIRYAGAAYDLQQLASCVS